ncbi:putative copper resistance protein D [Aneurinibacillus soli]|uniref:Copper resistance protein D n=1 Tax=Aneurinibacillus soli TaxID=1500254 RepID=A0A0U5B236_9BACL|nr:CopD family protein [Aneurinibacillus soli]PYE62170.1 putative copper resistance protein D [Aneurinibacillus soli]BAU28642.1 Copper resistance protein D [Aneurinibacillus soli]
MVIISHLLFYTGCSVLIGGLLMLAIPPSQRPPVHLPKGWLPGAALLLIISSFIPLLELATYAAEEAGTDFGTALQNVIVHFKHGQAWLLLTGSLLFLVIFLLLADIRHTPAAARLALVWSTIPVVLTSWTGHAASLAPISGWLSHMLHFLAVCVWTGVLYTSAWLTKGRTANWRAFLHWYTPLSISCVLALTATGLVLMHYTAPNYPVSLDGLYEKTLLLKHILFLPVLGLGFVNGFVIPKRMRLDAEFDVLRWMRIESIFVLAVFIATAFLSESPLPV